MNKAKNPIVWMPLVIAIAIVFGIYVGRDNYIEQSNYSTPSTLGTNKIDYLLQLIDKEYVDTVEVYDLIEDVLPKIMDELDPHSEYIPAKDLESLNEQLEGSFSGIGIQFSILEDTVMVVGIVSGGPSEKVGVLAGDRIVTVGDSAFVGKDINNERVMKTLRGIKGSEITIGIKRDTSSEVLDFTIVRDDIPDNSVDVAYMHDSNKGYMRISKFGKRTYEEMLNALAKLKQQGAESFIIDLRGNSGGYMDAAINMVNEFLPKGSLIVYTEGKAYPRSEAVSNGYGAFQQVPMVVLVDEFSASASEIFAGAIQDNDRGTIVGRRSFGKGLVQQQIPFSDGSAVRLTISRYYTPSGRSVQKEYTLGKEEDYNQDFINRFLHGELDVQDSIKQNDSLRYETMGGRIVFGGGGIMPDVFVPRDTVGVSSYLNEVVNKGLIYQFAFDYADKHRAELSQYSTTEAMEKYLKSQPILDQFVNYATTKGVKKRPHYINISRNVMTYQLHASIARHTLGDAAFYAIFMQDDPTLKKAVNILEQGDAFPELPVVETVEVTDNAL